MNSGNLALSYDIFQQMEDDGCFSRMTLNLIFSCYQNESQAMKEIGKFCIKTTSPKIQRNGMEFLYMNGMVVELQTLIAKNSRSNHRLNREWAEVYQLVITRLEKTAYDPQEALHKIKQFATDDPELCCIIEFLRVAVYFDLKAFGQIGNFLAKQPTLFDQVEDRVLLAWFHLRLNQNLFIYYWTRNEVIMARRSAFKVLNHTFNKNTMMNTHVNLALTYTFDTYNQAMYHLTVALQLAERKNDRGMIERIHDHNLPFLAAHFNQTDGIEAPDPSEQAHIEIARGHFEKAITILSQSPLKSPFQKYYMGLAKQDKHLLIKSYDQFINERSDYFFCRLPLNALAKLK